jgi:alpha-methylacyl-CoA racemase
LGPLHGVRVLELGGIGPGPFAAMLLADLGADVVRLERPDPETVADGAEILHRGKRLLPADLKSPADVELALGLAARADLLIEGFRPGVAERLGIGPGDVHRRNPALVYGRMTGWGQEGPLAQSAGHDITYLAVSGTLHLIGRAGGPPQIPVNLLGDFAGGSLYLVAGLLAALHHARTTGEGQVVDAAITDGATHLATVLYGLTEHGRWRDERGVNILDSGAPFYDVYECADGKYVAVGALEPQFFAALVKTLGLPDPGPQYDPAGWPALRAGLGNAFLSRTREEWTLIFENADACVAPVLSRAEAAAHPQLAARGTLVDGRPAPAPRFSVTVPAQPVPASSAVDVLAAWSSSTSQNAAGEKGRPSG